MSLNKSIFLFLLTTCISFYISLFTPLGHIFIKPILENKLSKELSYRMEIKEIESTPGKLYIKATSPEAKDIQILVKGTYSFTKGYFRIEAFNSDQMVLKEYKY